MACKKCIYTQESRAVRGFFIEEQRKCQVLDFGCLGKSYTVNRQMIKAEDMSFCGSSKHAISVAFPITRRWGFQSEHRETFFTVRVTKH